MDLEQRLEKLKDLRDNLNLYVKECIELNDNIITDLVTEDQLFTRGIGGDGNALDDYAPLTIKIKTEKGQPTDRVTLRDTRDFHNSFRIEADQVQFEIKADDWKTPVLISNYGKRILALSDENLKHFVDEYLQPYLLKKIE